MIALNFTVLYVRAIFEGNISSSVSIKILDLSSKKNETVKIQTSWLLQKPTDLDLHCLQRQGITEFKRTTVKMSEYLGEIWYLVP